MLFGIFRKDNLKAKREKHFLEGLITLTENGFIGWECIGEWDWMFEASLRKARTYLYLTVDGYFIYLSFRDHRDDSRYSLHYSRALRKEFAKLLFLVFKDLGRPLDLVTIESRLERNESRMKEFSEFMRDMAETGMVSPQQFTRQLVSKILKTPESTEPTSLSPEEALKRLDKATREAEDFNPLLRKQLNEILEQLGD
jgi:hypothetical protein